MAGRRGGGPQVPRWARGQDGGVGERGHVGQSPVVAAAGGPEGAQPSSFVAAIEAGDGGDRSRGEGRAGRAGHGAPVAAGCVAG